MLFRSVDEAKLEAFLKSLLRVSKMLTVGMQPAIGSHDTEHRAHLACTAMHATLGEAIQRLPVEFKERRVFPNRANNRTTDLQLELHCCPH
jgi:hypothetical protein